MSQSRRDLLVAGAAAVSASLAARPLAAAECARPARSRGIHSDYFPNVVLTTHTNQRVLFYDDLLQGGKTVLIHCMSVGADNHYPVCDNLSKVQSFLGDHLGRTVFIYSLSVDPLRDTPAALHAFARRQGARPGWLFLTGASADVELLRRKLFAQNGPHEHGVEPAKDCSVGLARYGNESIGLWGACPAKANPEWIARRLSWVRPRQPPVAGLSTGAAKRRGPHPDTWRS